MNPLTQGFSFNEIQPVSSNTSHRTSPTVLKIHLSFHSGLPGGSVGKNLPVNVGDSGLIPGSGRFPGEGNGNPLQYCCLGNPMDREACWATVYGIKKELGTATRLNNNSTFRLRFFFFS